MKARVMWAGVACFCVLLGWSAAVAFERHSQGVPLAATDRPAPPSMGQRPAPSVDLVAPVRRYEEVGVKRGASGVAPAATAATPSANAATPHDPATPARKPRVAPRSIGNAPAAGVKFDRFGKIIMVDGRPWTGAVFDHRPIRPVKTRTMKTTAYSPDERSCGKWADGITASGKSVWMNGGRLVAADRKIPYGTILTIPGYNGGKPVQVWDRGGKIKGNRLDLLYPTHEIALQWGVQDLPVVFWEFVETD